MELVSDMYVCMYVRSSHKTVAPCRCDHWSCDTGPVVQPSHDRNLTCLSSKLFKCVGLSNWLVPGLETTPSLDCRGCPIALERAALVIFSSSSLQAYVTGTVEARQKYFCVTAGEEDCVENCLPSHSYHCYLYPTTRI